MSPSRRKFLTKPLKDWSDTEILDLVAKVNEAKHTPEARIIVEQYMSRGTYARALKRVGLRKPKTAKEETNSSVHQSVLALGDALVNFFEAFKQAQGARRD